MTHPLTHYSMVAHGTPRIPTRPLCGATTGFNQIHGAMMKTLQSDKDQVVR